ncbi:MAG: hypothetical protein HN745_22610 [Deltaproteobacteria bacterium]|nr:hypothetical protein [Deltaproteobacteria bacterium]
MHLELCGWVGSSHWWLCLAIPEVAAGGCAWRSLKLLPVTVPNDPRVKPEDDGSDHHCSAMWLWAVIPEDGDRLAYSRRNYGRIIAIHQSNNQPTPDHGLRTPDRGPRTTDFGPRTPGLRPVFPYLYLIHKPLVHMAKKRKVKKTIRLPQTTESQIRSRARSLHFGVCYINENWEETREANILVSRKHKQGGNTFAVYLVDLASSGLMDTMYFFNMSNSEFDEFLADYQLDNNFIEVEYKLAHNIIYGAIDFAEDINISPDKDFSVSKYILEDDTDDVPFIEIEFGEDGEHQFFDEEADEFDDEFFDEFDDEFDDEFNEEFGDEFDSFLERDDSELKIWEELFTLCDQMYALKPWEKIYETDVFGIHLPDDNKDYFISVMGSDNQMLAISAYEGAQAISKFWGMINEDYKALPGTILTIPHMMISWSLMTELPLDQLLLLKALDKSYFDYPSWPNLQKIVPGLVPHTPDIWEVKNFIVILTQCLDVTKRAIKKPKLIRNDTMDDDAYLFRIPKSAGGQITWHDEHQLIPPQQVKTNLLYLPDDVKRYLRLPVGWDTIQANLDILPFPVKVKNGHDAYSFVMLFVNPDGGEVLTMHMSQALPSYDSLLEKLIDNYLKKCLELGKRPAKVEMQNPDMHRMIDFLETKAMTKAVLRLELPELEAAIDSLILSIEEEKG